MLNVTRKALIALTASCICTIPQAQSNTLEKFYKCGEGPLAHDRDICFQKANTSACKKFSSTYSFGDVEVCPGYIYDDRGFGSKFHRFGWLLTGKSNNTTDFYAYPNAFFYFTCDFEVVNHSGWSKNPRTLGFHFCQGTLDKNFD